MTQNPIFRGVATALITPLNENGVDYDALGKLIDWQIDQGINAIVICGTTGECSTLTDEEHKAVLKYSVERAAKRVPIIAGTGSNDTAYAISLTKYASEIGADACLVVTPYYNKCTQSGLVKVYTAIADASDIPIIIYNVPSRTGVGFESETYLKLADHPMIQGIKEANGDISKIMHTMRLVGEKLDVYSGNDDQVVPFMSIGGAGVISTVSNVWPSRTVEMCDKFYAGDIKGATDIQFELLPLIDYLFCQVNPIPVKAAMSSLGFCENYLRLPLDPMDKTKEAGMLDVMKGLGLL